MKGVLAEEVPQEVGRRSFRRYVMFVTALCCFLVIVFLNVCLVTLLYKHVSPSPPHLRMPIASLGRRFAFMSYFCSDMSFTALAHVLCVVRS